MPEKARFRVPAGRRHYGASGGGISTRAPGDYAEDPGAYPAASSSYRATGWGEEHHDADSRLFSQGVIIRARSRAAVAQNWVAKSGVDKLVSNAIGTGIVPRSAHPDPMIRDQLHQLFEDWSLTADSAGLLNFYGLQSMAVQSMIEGGEVFARHRPRRPEDKLIVPYQVELIEAEFLPFHYNSLNGKNVIKAGIEFDPLGRRVAYHLYRSHPGSLGWGLEVNGVSRIPAEQVVHLFQPHRPGQCRGIPWLATVLNLLNDIDEYAGAEIVRKKTAAMFTAFVTSNNPQVVEQSLFNSLAQDKAGFFAELSPGTVQMLDPGEDVKFATPTDDGASYETFIRGALRAVAAGMGLSYEQLTGDLTGINYSSIRAGLLEFRRRITALQHQVIVQQFCQPIWKEWIKTAIISHFSREFSRDPDLNKWCRVRWMPPAWDWVDPEKDIRANVLAIQNGLTSRARVVAESGEDVEEIDQEQKTDQDRETALGLSYATTLSPAAKE